MSKFKDWYTEEEVEQMDANVELAWALLRSWEEVQDDLESSVWQRGMGLLSDTTRKLLGDQELGYLLHCHTARVRSGLPHPLLGE